MKIQADVYLTTLGYGPMPKKDELSGWETKTVTEKQKATLNKYGIAYARVKYKGQASLLLGIIFKRAEEHLATPKQIQFLLKNGYNSGKIRYLTVKGASRIITQYTLEK